MKINSYQEKYKYLKHRIKDKSHGSYALVTYDGHTETIWIANLGKGFSKNKSKYYLEAPVQLYTYDINDETRENFEEYGYIIRGDKAYEINVWQTLPFLSEVIDDLRLISEEECLNWLLEHENKQEN